MFLDQVLVKHLVKKKSNMLTSGVVTDPPGTPCTSRLSRADI